LVSGQVKSNPRRIVFVEIQHDVVCGGGTLILSGFLSPLTISEDLKLMYGDIVG